MLQNTVLKVTREQKRLFDMNSGQPFSYSDKFEALRPLIDAIQSAEYIQVSKRQIISVQGLQLLKNIDLSTIKYDPRIREEISREARRISGKLSVYNFVAFGFLYSLTAPQIFKKLFYRSGNAINVLTKSQFNTLMFAFIHYQLNKADKGLFCRSDVMAGNVSAAKKYIRPGYLRELTKLGYLNRVLDIPPHIRERDRGKRVKPHYFIISSQGRKALKLFISDYMELIQGINIDIFSKMDHKL